MNANLYCSVCTQQEQNALPQWYSKKTMQSYTAELCLDHTSPIIFLNLLLIRKLKHSKFFSPLIYNRSVHMLVSSVCYGTIFPAFYKYPVLSVCQRPSPCRSQRKCCSVHPALHCVPLCLSLRVLAALPPHPLCPSKCQPSLTPATLSHWHSSVLAVAQKHRAHSN